MDELDRICGYCHTNNHDMCRPKITWYDKVWYCNCKTCQEQEKVETNTNEEAIQEPIHQQEEEAESN